MKWKTALTAEEAALLITGLSKYYSSLAQVKDDLASNEVTNPYDEYYVDYLNQKANFDEAISSIMGSTSFKNLTRPSWLVKSLFCVKY